MQNPLRRVGLLHDAYRIYFQLKYPESTSGAQICSGDQTVSTTTADTTSGGTQYTIGVNFRTRILGKFEQWIVFDFDDKPVVFRKLIVRVGSEEMEELATPSSVVEPCETWDSSNSDIVPFNRYHNRGKTKAATSDEGQDSKYRLTELDDEAGILDRDNYHPFMHVMLKMEEKERVTLLKRYVS